MFPVKARLSRILAILLVALSACLLLAAVEGGKEGSFACANDQDVLISDFLTPHVRDEGKLSSVVAAFKNEELITLGDLRTGALAHIVTEERIIAICANGGLKLGMMNGVVAAFRSMLEHAECVDVPTMLAATSTKGYRFDVPKKTVAVELQLYTAAVANDLDTLVPICVASAGKSEVVNWVHSSVRDKFTQVLV